MNNLALDFSKTLNTAAKKELAEIIEHFFSVGGEDIAVYADAFRRKHYGKKVFFRGLIEFTSHCKNDCLYCGIRGGNKNAKRYRLTKEEILECCQTGYDLGFRTFVLQGGEDPHYTDSILCDIVCDIKSRFSDCAVTLSAGERSRDSYKSLKDAGADRYLLRHETANSAHYKKIHPKYLSFDTRRGCLFTLKELGYQVGAGFMVGSPFQTCETLADDLIFLRTLNPHMVGIGPFIPHKDTVFSGYSAGKTSRTLVMLSLVRIMLPAVLLPATTALGTIDPQGREKALRVGANVVMPNLSPIEHREEYSLYDNKICTGEEAAECLACISNRIKSAGFVPDFSRGDYCD